MKKGQITINVLERPTAVMWNAWYCFQEKELGFKIAALQEQRNKILFEMERLGIVTKQVRQALKVDWTLTKKKK